MIIFRRITNSDVQVPNESESKPPKSFKNCQFKGLGDFKKMPHISLKKISIFTSSLSKYEAACCWTLTIIKFEFQIDLQIIFDCVIFL